MGEKEAKLLEEDQQRVEEEEERARALELQRFEDAKKFEQAQQVFRQQQATLAILQMVYMLTTVTPDNFKLIKAKYEEVVEMELNRAGMHCETLRPEVNKLLEHARQV